MQCLQYMPAFEETPYLTKIQFEQNPPIDWDKIFYDHKISLSSSPCESFGINATVPHPSPCSTEFDLDCESELFSSFDFDDMINWDHPQAYLPGESVPTGSHTTPRFRSEKRANPSNYISPSVDSISTLSDDLDDIPLSFEGSSEGIESPKDTLNSPLESPLSWRPDIYLPSHLANKAKPCEPLSLEEEARLVAIAMGIPSSPTTESPIPSTNTRSKRKSSSSLESDYVPPRNSCKRTKVNQHNLIEKRYREKMNDAINSLRKVVPGLQGTNDSDEISSQDSVPVGLRVNKATILSKAIEHILELENRTNCILKDNQSLKTRVDAYERLLVAPQTAARFMKTDK